MRIVRSIVIAAVALGALAACGGDVKESLGLNKKAPDEFRVVSRPPLSLPPEFALRPPSDGAEGEAMVVPREQAKALLFGGEESAARAPGLTEAETAFLRNAGALHADGSAREDINREEARRKREEPSALRKYTTLPPKEDPLVDAKAEAERLRRNQEQGRPVTEGETPEIQPKDRGVLGQILGD